MRYAGAGAMLSHSTAAEVSGLLDDPVDPIHVTVPSGRHVAAQPGLVVHHSARTAQARHPGRTLPQTRIEETVVDLTQHSTTLDRAVWWMTAACRRRLTTTLRLRAALDRRKKLRWRPELAAALSDVASGCHSALERLYLNRVERAHGLPRGARQAPGRTARRRRYDDIRYAPWPVLVELDGQIAHPEEERFRDLDRDNASVTAGARVLRYGWGDIHDRPCAVAAQVGAVLRQSGWTRSPRPCGPTCVIMSVPGSPATQKPT